MTIDSFTIADPRTAPTAAQIARPSKEANHKPKSVMLGKPMKTIADVKVANAKGQISLGLERFSSCAPARTATVTKTLYGKIKIAEKSTP